MQFENADKVIEVVLQEVMFSNDREVTLSLIVGQLRNKVDIKWTVSVAGTTQKPVTFFDSYESAWEELKRRCGECSLGGLKMIRNKKHGEIKGSYGAQPKTSGFVVRKEPIVEQETEAKFKEPTVRLESINR
ncbi:MAG: hypothetical protein CMI54_07615 [Parcubacteria group bacterium]|jgi:hypothetical protein|nr:hypothetical protein [Parcubacteria group bacterium]|tara:strand:+ start:1734 stop:2129 length:396 start_codon:yes stop_codon:yes gene_type:complete